MGAGGRHHPPDATTFSIPKLNVGEHAFHEALTLSPTRSALFAHYRSTHCESRSQTVLYSEYCIEPQYYTHLRPFAVPGPVLIHHPQLPHCVLPHSSRHVPPPFSLLALSTSSSQGLLERLRDWAAYSSPAPPRAPSGFCRASSSGTTENTPHCPGLLVPSY